MKTKLTCLVISTVVFTSCKKSGTEAKSEDTALKKPQTENQVVMPKITEKVTVRSPIDPPLRHPVTVEMIVPAGVVAGDSSWQAHTAEQMIEKFRASGVARMPKDISDKLIENAASAGDAAVQVQFITQQAAAWHQINEFKIGVNDVPEHMRMDLVEKLFTKHGNSWVDMLPELEEQMAASRKVMEFRLNGIPGMTPDESQEFFIDALYKYGSDYKTVLSIAEQNVKK